MTDDFKPASAMTKQSFRPEYEPKFSEQQLLILAHGLTHGLKVSAAFATLAYGDKEEKAKQGLMQLTAWNCIKHDRDNLGWFIVRKEACPPKAWDVARMQKSIQQKIDEEDLEAEESKINNLLDKLK